MPYTRKQCRKFATMKNPPKDWKKYCRKDSVKKVSKALAYKAS